MGAAFFNYVIEVVRKQDGSGYWRLTTGKGHPVGQSIPYAKHETAKKAAKKLFSFLRGDNNFKEVKE